jgi:ATP-dependent DNA helicase RecG
MMPPTFESNHSLNQFTTRLLLHHFLGEEDLKWLAKFKAFNLNEQQKCAIIFMREVGAIDNSTYRQLNGVEMSKVRKDLPDLKEKGIFTQKGKGRATYYVPGEELIKLLPVQEDSVHGDAVSVHGKGELVNKLDGLTNQSGGLTPQFDGLTPQLGGLTPQLDGLTPQLPIELQNKLEQLGQRVNSKDDTTDIILELCEWKALTLSQLSYLMKRKHKKYLKNTYLTPLRKEGKLEYTIPEMPNHPKQAYRTVNKK